MARSLWRTELGAGDGSGGGEEAGGRRGQGLRRGRDVMNWGTACTCPDAGGEGEGESGRVSRRKGAGLGDPHRLKVWEYTLR